MNCRPDLLGDQCIRFLTAAPEFSTIHAMTTLDQFNRLGAAAAFELIARCCASARWSKRMVASRPYGSVDELTQAADRHWRSLAQRDFLEAFGGHPKIGDPNSANGAPAGNRRIAADEQAGAAGATARVSASLARHNDVYEEKFGFIFIVCASGKTAEQMLSLLRARLRNTRAEELVNAAEEQRKITQLRIRKLFA